VLSNVLYFIFHHAHSPVQFVTSYAEAAQALDQAVNLFMEIGRLSMAARYCKDIGEIYQQEQDLEKASDYLERAADLFDSEGQTSQSNTIKQKVAEIAAQLEQYPKATEIFEAIARQSINNNLLKYSVRGILLNAGICQLCRAEPVAIQNSLERYQVYIVLLKEPVIFCYCFISEVVYHVAGN
jgi:alpha-soluble NSF attachment protein